MGPVNTIFGLIFLSLLQNSLSASLRITNLKVPTTATHEALIDCKYQIEDAQLYDVKWYKDGMQFYACKGDGSVMEYSVHGVKIYHTQYASRGSCPVTLTALTKDSSGEYTCEVSLEGNFLAVSQSSYLNYVEPSKEVNKESRNEKNIIEDSTGGCSALSGHNVLLFYFIILILTNCFT